MNNRPIIGALILAVLCHVLLYLGTSGMSGHLYTRSKNLKTVQLKLFRHQVKQPALIPKRAVAKTRPKPRPKQRRKPVARKPVLPEKPVVPPKIKKPVLPEKPVPPLPVKKPAPISVQQKKPIEKKIVPPSVPKKKPEPVEKIPEDKVPPVTHREPEIPTPPEKKTIKPETPAEPKKNSEPNRLKPATTPESEEPEPPESANPHQVEEPAEPIQPDTVDPDADKAPVTVAIPKYRENPKPIYPRIARRRGYQGEVVLEVLVGKRGNVDDLRVVESSGYPPLDESAMDAVKDWNFEPATRGGIPEAMWVRVPIRFSLSD